MLRQIEDAQNAEYYKAQRQIQKALVGNTPVKMIDNRQYIDNVSANDRDVQRISKSIHHNLDLGQNSLLGAQQSTTVATAAAMKTQGDDYTPKVHVSEDDGQNNREKYKMAEYIIPLLDGTHNASDSRDLDTHSYLDLVNIEIIKPNTTGRKARQKAPDDEIIEIDKIVKDDTPRYTIKQQLKDVLHARKSATESERKQRETRKLDTEKSRQLLIETELKEKEAKRRALAKAKISALIEKHICHKLDIPDEVTTMGTGKNSNNTEKEGTKRYHPHIKRHQMQAKLNCLKLRVQNLRKMYQRHY